MGKEEKREEDTGGETEVGDGERGGGVDGGEVTEVVEWKWRRNTRYAGGVKAEEGGGGRVKKGDARIGIVTSRLRHLLNVS